MKIYLVKVWMKTMYDVNGLLPPSNINKISVAFAKAYSEIDTIYLKKL